MYEGKTIAHEWNSPIGCCPCGCLTWVMDDETEHTCGLCGETYPVVRFDGRADYEVIHALTHERRRR